MKIVQISDTHLTRHGGTTNENFAKIAEFINDVLQPDVVVHTGDIAIMDPDQAEDRATASELLDLLRPPLHVLPGNHDIGDSSAPWVVSSDRVRAFTETYGDDHWLQLDAEVALIGIDSEVLGVGLPEEKAQWEWLESLPDQVGSRRVLAFSHKAPWDPAPEPASHPMSIPAEAAERLRGILDRMDVAAYGSGHLHRYLLERHDDVWAVSAPATAFTAGSAADYPGLRQLGVVEYDVTDRFVTPVFRTIPTLVERDLRDLEEVQRALRESGLVIPA